LATTEFFKSSSVRGLFCNVGVFEYLYLTSRFKKEVRACAITEIHTLHNNVLAVYASAPIESRY